MSEKHLKLKLKRKKVAIQGDTFEQNSSIVVKKSTVVPIPFSSFEKDQRSEETGDPSDNSPVEWWARPDLQAVEKLWAVTLKCAIPYLGHSVWETVPDLPPASAVTPSVEAQSGWKWCSLSEEVASLPSPPKPTARSSAILEVCGPGALLHPTDTGVVSEGAASPPCPAPQKGRLSSVPAHEEAGEGRCAPNPRPPQDHRPKSRTGGQPQSTLSSWEVLGAGQERGERDGGPCEEERPSGRASLEGAGSGRAEGGAIKRRLPAHAGGGAASWAAGEQHGRAEFPMGEGPASGNAQAPRRSAGEAPAAAAVPAAMETCPMCLLQFPSGFTQMDCDSHLAKCLSEMGDDMTW